VLHNPIWQSHPNHGGNAALRSTPTRRNGLHGPHGAVQQAVRANPGRFSAAHVGNRFQEAILVYVPFNTAKRNRRPDQTWYARLVYPLRSFAWSGCRDRPVARLIGPSGS